MKKKKIIKIAAVTALSTLILFTVLIVHIAMVTNPKGKDHYGVQLSRIDFNTALDSAKVADITSYVKSIKGVGNAVYNYKYNNLVFSYQSAETNSETVFNQLLSEKHVDARRYQISAADLAITAKCPVLNNKGVLKSFAHTIQVYFL